MTTATTKHHSRMMAFLAVILSLAVLFVPLASENSDATYDDEYTYVIHPDGTIEGDYNPIGNAAYTGRYTSTNNQNSGSWTWDEDGYGPFNSFYAAFDPAQDNRMVGHLDPDDLTKLVDGSSIAGQNYNVMWCLPTVYWLTDSSGNLILTNNPNSGGTAFAHTIEGYTYRYIAIGVYEASILSVGGQTILTSRTDVNPTVNQTREVFRDQANNQSVNTDGFGTDGYAMIWNFYMYELYKYCALATIGSWDSQGVAGAGATNGSSANVTGDHDKNGPYAGTTSTSVGSSRNKDSVKVFIENAWGSANDFVDGIIISSLNYYIDQSAVPTDTTSGPYITNPSGSLPDSRGYGSNPSTETAIWGMPTATEGSYESGLYDYVDATTSEGLYSVSVGGNYYPGSYWGETWFRGFSQIICDEDLSVTGKAYCARLAFVFDIDPATSNVVTYDHSVLAGAGIDSGDIDSDYVGSTSVPNGESITLPDLGTIDDYQHIGWYINGTFHKPGYEFTPAEDTTIKSAWQPPSVIITMHVGDVVYATLAVPKGSSGVVFTPVDANGVFTGWFYDPSFQDEYDPVIPVDSNLDLYAKGIPPLIFTTDPVADGEVKAIEGQPGTISFRATDSKDYTSALWDFGDGTVSNDLYSTHYYSQPGTYTATLTVFNNFGSDTTEFIIEVPEIGAGGGGNDLLLLVAAVLAIAVAGGLVVRRFL